ncbi:hypothetical protein BaRGS_00025172, partial [Batillaria attramentaria]
MAILPLGSGGHHCCILCKSSGHHCKWASSWPSSLGVMGWVSSQGSYDSPASFIIFEPLGPINVIAAILFSIHLGPDNKVPEDPDILGITHLFFEFPPSPWRSVVSVILDPGHPITQPCSQASLLWFTSSLIDLVPVSSFFSSWLLPFFTLLDVSPHLQLLQPWVKFQLFGYDPVLAALTTTLSLFCWTPAAPVLLPNLPQL